MLCNIKVQPICEWYKKFQQSGCPCSTKQTARPGPSAETVERVQETFVRSPQKSTLDWGICSSQVMRCVGFWGPPDRSFPHTFDGLGQWPQQSCSFHSTQAATVLEIFVTLTVDLSVAGSVWYLVQNLRCTVTVDSVLANSKTQNAFLSPLLAMFRHDCPLVVKPATTPWHLLPKQTWRDCLPIDISFLLCLSWLCWQVQKFRGTYELSCILSQTIVYVYE
jgi:hypothetical protein